MYLENNISNDSNNSSFIWYGCSLTAGLQPFQQSFTHIDHTGVMVVHKETLIMAAENSPLAGLKTWAQFFKGWLA